MLRDKIKPRTAEIYPIMPAGFRCIVTESDGREIAAQAFFGPIELRSKPTECAELTYKQAKKFARKFGAI